MAVTANTGIHTKVNEKYRISSIYRAWDTYEGTLHGWENILWCKEEGKEKIADITVDTNAQDAIERHARIFDKIVNLNDGEW